MNIPALFHTDCPACGAPVQVHSPTAVTVVCGYCNSMLVRQADGLRDSGRDSALMQDFSPLQVGTSGRFAAKNFVLLGRLQARYDAGVWNEWYARFEDGSTGWLSEAGDLYVFVREAAPPPNLPAFDDIRAGESRLDYGRTFTASDVRRISLSQATAEGELPFRLPENGENRVADWRCENLFLTLDYGSSPPAAFLGKTVSLNELGLHNTRNEQQILQSAGSLKGSTRQESCPNCGSPVHWLAGLTANVVCQACGSELDTSGKKAELIAANAMRHAQEAARTLPIGANGVLHGRHYTVIGAVRQEELDEEDALAILDGYPPEGVRPRGWWFEYLLYNPQHGFRWLVETPEDGWFFSETLAEFPRLSADGSPQGKPFAYAYGGRVSYAAGAFYWHVRAGDVTLYRDFWDGKAKLCAERGTNELAWSRSTPVPFAEIAQAFRLPEKHAAAGGVQMRAERADNNLRTMMTLLYCLINLPAWLMMDGDDFVDTAIPVSFVVLILLWYHDGKNDDD